MSDNVVDDVTRSWAQMFHLLMQLRHQARMLGGTNSVRLTRAQHKEFARQLQQTVLIHQYAHETSREWFQARVRDYQHESAAVRARLQAGASPEQHERMTAYLSGLRHSIETTIHTTPLTAEERGQTLHVLQSVDHDPQKPVPHNIFQPMTKVEAARARYTAAASEHRVVQHREQLATTRSTASEQTRHHQTVDADTAAWHEQNTQLLNTLNKRVTALQQQVAALHARQTATATTGSNGHSAPKETQRAEQHAANAAQEQAHQVSSQQASTTPTATAATEQAEADIGQPDPEAARLAAQQEQWAQMQAEA